MAKGKEKKNFLLYKDMISSFEKLTNEEAGKLIKHIFRYVNCLNPITEDRITELMFEPIKQTLERDLDNWRGKCAKNSDIANMRWHANASERIKNDAKHADSDRDRDRDRDREVKKKVKKEKVFNDLVFPFASAEFNNTWNILIKEKKWKNKSPTALQKSLDLLGKYSEADAVEMMNQTIRNSYQGLFEIKKYGSATKIGVSEERINAASNF